MDQYVRASNETDVTKLKDQLLQCPDDTLGSALHRAMGDQVDTITVTELLKEIEELAVVKQSNNVNTLALISAKQERDELVRQFAARLRGLAAVCDLTVTCSQGHTASEVDKWARMSLISGLYEEDTKQAVLSKVEEMPFDEMITFVEARETGRTSMKILAGNLSSGVVNKVHEDREDPRSCQFCGKEGHGRNPGFDLRKADCPAFGKKCKKCGLKGHFAEV